MTQQITLDELAMLARKMGEYKQNIDDCKDRVAEAEEKLRVLKEETIPNIMTEIGVTSIQLDSGEIIEIKQEVYAQPRKEDKPLICEWLNDNGFGGLIKVMVAIQFGKGDQEEAVNLFQELNAEYSGVLLTEDIHPQTLKAFLREQITKGKNIPLDLFGAKPVMEAKLKKSK